MNPTSASIPAVPRVNDVAAPRPAVPTPEAPLAAQSTIVANIPVHNAQTPAAAASEDDELDKIMHDVGQEMKKEDNQPQKHGFLGFGHKSRPQPPAVGPAVHRAPPLSQPAPLPTAAPAQAAPITKPQTLPPALAKPQQSKSVPVFAIFVALLVAGFLTAAAIAAYRQ